MKRVSTVTSKRWAAGSEDAKNFPEGAHVTVMTDDGRSFEHFNGMARGTTARPLTESEIAGKFMDCASRAMDDSSTSLNVVRFGKSVSAS